VANEDVERIRSAMYELCEPLHDVFTWADQRRREQLPDLDGKPAYQWHATHTIRAYAHLRMSGPAVDLGRWGLAGNHAHNGELWLSDGDYQLRLLHALREADVPPPGLNGERRAFYRNTPLFRMDPQMKLIGPPDDRLLIVWRIDRETRAPIFRVVRPIGNWRYGDHALTDVDFILPDTAADLAALTFEPSDEGMELDIPNEGDQEGGADAGNRAG
jgi:hypothetical protein